MLTTKGKAPPSSAIQIDQKFRGNLEQLNKVSNDYDARVKTLCNDESFKKVSDAFRRAQKDLHKKMEEMSNDPQLKQLEKQQTTAYRAVNRRMADAMHALEDRAIEIEESSSSSKEKQRQRYELEEHARKQLQEAMEVCPALSKLTALHMLRGRGTNILAIE